MKKLILLLCLLYPCFSWADAVPLTDDLLASEGLTGGSYPHIAMNENGKAIVVWRSVDEDGAGIWARIYSPDGKPTTAPFLVNENTAGNQIWPWAGMDAQGNSVIVWYTYERSNGGDIRARRFGPDGVPMGPEFGVNNGRSFYPPLFNGPRIGVAPTGHFAVTWAQMEGTVMGRIYGPDGSPITGALEVYIYQGDLYHQTMPDVSAAKDRFVFAWRSSASLETGVYARIVDFNGNPLTGLVKVNEDTTTSSYFYPSVAVDSEGNFTVSWSGGHGGGGYDVYARRFNTDAAPITAEFRVNTYLTGLQWIPSVSRDPDGYEEVIAWMGYGQDESSYGVFAQRYDVDGTPINGAFQVNLNALGSWGKVAMAGKERFAITWRGPLPGTMSPGHIWVKFFGPESNQIPVANAGPDQTISCSGSNGAAVTLNGSGSSDPDGDALTYTWTGIFGTATGVNPQVQIPLGTYSITLKVDDGKGGTAEDTVVITVQDSVPPSTSATITGTSGNNGWYKSDVNINLTSTDNCSGAKEIHYIFDGAETIISGSAATLTIAADGRHNLSYWAVDYAGNIGQAKSVEIMIDRTPPVLSVTLNPGLLWPPNHKMVNIMPSITVSDNLTSNVQVELISVTSSEPDNGLGDGDTANDIVVNADGTLSLRAERAGTGNGRVYTITYRATDFAGNATISSATAVVPHEMRK
ncbi:MAG: VBCS repeat-containing protein [Nitrospirae bacterium]|nr:MAG: VBCS repeat-containing protein [Nitrospirota bacterium]